MYVFCFYIFWSIFKDFLKFSVFIKKTVMATHSAQHRFNQSGLCPLLGRPQSTDVLWLPDVISIWPCWPVGCTRPWQLQAHVVLCQLVYCGVARKPLQELIFHKKKVLTKYLWQLNITLQTLYFQWQVYSTKKNAYSLQQK